MLACEATGTTGSAVLRELDGAGVRVRAKTRSPESAERLPRPGVEVAVSDLGDPATLPAALDGIDAAYLAYPASSELSEPEGNPAPRAHEFAPKRLSHGTVGATSLERD